jgi:ABC-type Mn2+/Zn2+ transport system permease subunit
MVGTFIAGYGAEMLQRTLQHVSMVGVALVLAVSIGMSLGIVISGHERVARWATALFRNRAGQPVHGDRGMIAITVLGLAVNAGLVLVEDASMPGTRGRGERT